MPPRRVRVECITHDANWNLIFNSLHGTLATQLPTILPWMHSLRQMHHQRTFSTHGWSLQPGHHNSRALAASWMTLATSTELKSWEEKRGGFYQHDTHRSLVCSHLGELPVRLRTSSKSLGRSVRHHTGSPLLRSSCCDTGRLMRISLLPFSEAQSSSYHAAFDSLFGTQKRNRSSNAADQLNCQLALSWLRESLSAKGDPSFASLLSAFEVHYLHNQI